MKNLRKVLVFVLFALATVFAFGLNSVKADDAAIYTANFEEAGAYQSNSSSNSYTTTKKYTTGGVEWTLVNADSVISGTPISGTANIMGRIGKNKTNSCTATTGLIAAATVSKIEYKVNMKVATLTYKAEYSTDGSTWIELGTASNVSGKKTYTHDVEITGSIYLKFTLTITDGTTATSNRDAQLDDIVVYGTLSADVEQLETPNATLENGVVSWDAVEGAEGYKVGVFATEDGTSTSEIFAVEETTLDLSAYTPQGTHYVKVQALGDGAATSNSEWAFAGTIENGDEAIEMTVTEALAATLYYNATKVVITGKVSSFYQAYDSQYENVSLNVTDGTNTIVAYRATGTSASTVQVGDIVTVEGALSSYKQVNQLAQGCEIIDCKPLCAVGAQTAEAEDGAQHIRFVAGLNVNWEEVETLSFTITDANNDENTVTLSVSNVFGTLVANGETGVEEVTAASQGFECLFAVTITNVTAGTTLNVTATFTTASGTYTSAVKTVAVPAAE